MANLSLSKIDFINLPTSELLQLTNKEIISVIGFVPMSVKKERSRLANFTKCMPKNPSPEYKAHFSNTTPWYAKP